MKPDITPPAHYQRGTITPPTRDVTPVTRPVAPRPVVKFQDVVAVKPVIPSPPQVADPLPPVTPTQPVFGAEISAPTPVTTPSRPAAAEVVVPEPTAPSVVKLEEKPVKQNKVKAPGQKKFSWKKHGLIILAIILLIVTGYVAYDTWMTNRAAQATSGGNAEQTVGAAWDKEDEGKDETPITGASLASYTVSSDLPRALYIDKLKIAARTLPMSVNTDGSVQSPRNIFDAGWYTGSVKPGEIGAVFIDGHASGATREGLFAYLDTLKVGDIIQIEKGDGSRLTYRVVNTEVVPLDGLDMKKVLLPQDGVTRGLNIMTCTGKWVNELKTYDHRVLIYTEQVNETE